MSAALGVAITVLVAATLVSFAWGLVSMRRLPLGERPRTPTYDRFGDEIGELENPDFHENPGEDKSASVGLAPPANLPRRDRP